MTCKDAPQITIYNCRNSPPLIDAAIPHHARVYDFLLGGKNNFEADRALAREMMQAAPDTVILARANRDFLARAVRFLAGEAGIRQFLDIGTGLPAEDNIHEVAQAVAPESRVVYVDNDPIVLAHARALLVSSPPGACDYVEADANNPGQILGLAEDTLDFSRPLAITMLGILHALADPYAVVRALMRAVPSGSYLAVSVTASDIDAERQAALLARLRHALPAIPTAFRSRPEMERFFDGLELVDPGVTTASRWRPVPGTPDHHVAIYAAVARKP